jgi:hypothetical protein
MGKKLSRAEIERRLNQEWNAILGENKIIPDQDAVKKVMKKGQAQPEFLIALGFTSTIGMLLQNYGRTIATTAKIKDEQHLVEVIKLMREAGYKLPTVIRKAMREIASTLPRHGGPGRNPKLTPKEGVEMCSQIGMFITQGDKLKEALQRASDLTQQLLGKKVSPRTLQKAWDKRRQQSS